MSEVEEKNIENVSDGGDSGIYGIRSSTRTVIKKIIYMVLTNKSPDTNDGWLPEYIHAIEKVFYTYAIYIYISGNQNKHYIDTFYREISAIKNDNFNSKTLKCKGGFKSDVFSSYREIEEEADGFQENPVEIKEGVFMCGKCGSDKTVHFQSQTRSADEAMTNFVQCIKCNKRWKE
jgi:DNA-directed RNA polymerase subunit M/transcription elongation factor TFIIS